MHSRTLQVRGVRRPYLRLALGLGCLAFLGTTGVAGVAPAMAQTTATSVPHYDHIFLIMEENNGFHDIIGNPAAPNFNYLARQFGLATDYYGVNGTSEPNYVGILGGSTFNINSDDAYWTEEINAPNLMSELDQAGISWKAYLQGLPHPDYQGICYPAKCNGAPDSDPLYVSKHDGIQNYTTSLNPTDWSRQVPISELWQDLSSGNVPTLSYVVPDECHDMHGDPPYCLDSGNYGDPQNQHLVALGDAYLGRVVSAITNASFWSQGNNAIAITYDSGNGSGGCCDANPGGGQVATVVITSHGPRAVQDAAPANHYSMLSTIQHALGVGCLQYTCDTANVQPLTPLFAMTGSTPIATKVLGDAYYPTPSPTPVEPTSMTPGGPTSGGFTVQGAQVLGTSDNSLGAIAGSSPDDVWSVGDFLPDQTDSNQDATLSFAEHFNGSTWSVVPTPNTGSNFNSFYGVTASQGDAWAVGEYLNYKYQDRALVEVWNGKNWAIADNPQPGPMRDMLFGASALSPDDVWVVGDQEGSNGIFETLAEHWDGTSWSVVPTPDPGTTGNHLYAVDAVGPDDVWAVGQQLGAQAPDQGLVEHWDGQAWSVVPTPASPSASVLLDGVAVSNGDVWAVGEADSPQGGLPLIEGYTNGAWTVANLPPGTGSNWSNLYGVTVADGTVWVAGTYVDPTTDNNNVLVLRGDDNGANWSVDPAPNPGSGSNIPGGITSIEGQVWVGGVYDNGGNELPLIEYNPENG